ncbi:MAG: ExbD/TolR family protein [Pseudomonadota bacterium]
MGGSTSLRGGRTRRFKAEINVVPYIDVMLVLLVIFMVAAPLANPSVINLPTAGKSAQPPTKYIQVTLEPDNRSSIGLAGSQANAQANGAQPEKFDNRAALLRRLRSLHAETPDMPLMISADKDIRYDEVIQMISEAKKAGLDRVGLATR